MLPLQVTEELFEKVPAIIAVLLGENFVFSKANARYRSIFTDREIMGKPIREALPELEGQGIFELLEEVYRTGIGFEGKEREVLLQTSKNSQPQIHYFNFTYDRLTDENNNPVGIYVFGHDVTELVTSRKRVEESEEQLRQFVESMPQMAFIAAANGDITYFNRPWYEYVKGLDGTEGWGWKDKPIHHPDDLPIVIRRWSHSIESGEPYEIEYRLRRHDGVYRWHLGRANPIKDRDGKITKWIGTNTDIHDKKEIEERLENAIRSRDEFLSIASHELKTPLTAMHLQNQIYKRAAKKADSFDRQRVEDMVDQNERQVYRLRKLVEDMLDVSRIRVGKLKTYKELGDLSVHLRDIVEKMFPQFLQKGFPEPELFIDPDIEADYDMLRIEQVLTNLLLNAIRYGEKKPVTVSLQKTHDHVMIKIKDRGIGISQSDKERIFEKFERGIDSYDVSGLGLGLYISKKIIEAHDGEISVEARPGQGSEFTITLPLPVQASSVDDQILSNDNPLLSF